MGKNLSDIAWRNSAREDLHELLAEISRHNPQAASNYIDDIVSSIEKLRQFPHVGTVYNEYYRMMVVRKHLIFYRIEENENKVFIVNVIYGGRDIESIVSLQS